MNLRIPGPTNCRTEILAAVGGQMINHRGPDMGELIRRVTGKLHSFLDTRRDILYLTTSGTGGLEAAIVNTLSAGDRVLSVSAGAFGNRFRSIAEVYGAAVIRLDVEWGRAIDPEQVRQALVDGRPIHAVLLTHCETSTGVTHPLGEICEAIRSESDALILVDAISSLGGIALPLEPWGVDVAVAGSQKAWGVPPGLAMVVFGTRAWEAYEHASMPRLYLDLAKYRDAALAGQYPYTPALPVFYGLDKALELMLEEGPEAVYARHVHIATLFREGIQALGLTLLADADNASNTVTAVRVPEGIDGKELIRILRERYDTVVAGGLAELVGRIFRLGHLGWVNEQEVNDTLAAVAGALSELGYVAPGRA